MGVSLKTEQRRSHTTVSSFRPWVRRAEGYRGTRHLQSCRQVPLKTRRPPSLPLICIVFPAYSSFSVFRETPMASAIHLKKLKCYHFSTSSRFPHEPCLSYDYANLNSPWSLIFHNPLITMRLMHRPNAWGDGGNGIGKASSKLHSGLDDTYPNRRQCQRHRFLAVSNPQSDTQGFSVRQHHHLAVGSEQ
jgi:hypothetical protein